MFILLSSKDIVWGEAVKVYQNTICRVAIEARAYWYNRLMRPLLKKEYILLAFASLFASLSVLHHSLNFWERQLYVQAVSFLLTVPIFVLALARIYKRISPFFFKIQKMRWMFFLAPSLAISLLAAGYVHRVPTIWHTLQITPQGEGTIELHEIKIPPGKTLKFERARASGWILDGGVFKTASGADMTPLEFSFRAPIGQPASLLFLRLPGSPQAMITLNGKLQRVALDDAAPSLYVVQMPINYKAGIPAGLILGIIFIADVVLIFGFLLIVWLIQEISQFSEIQSKDAFAFPHIISILILLALAFIFHALNFFSVPLIVASDSPSYLAGALHWLQFGNLDGVPAARGPGITFLFLPAFWLAGNNPAGVKFILHLFAIGCVPLAYGLAWRLYNRRIFAFFSGALLLFIPEMYQYSNIVMSDVPNVFFVLAYCLVLLTACDTLSPRHVIFSMLIGAFAVLLRPENILLLAIGAGFLFVKIIRQRENYLNHLRIFGVGVMLAALPLLYWSFHNYRAHGFFGLSNYAGEVLYDGWIYFGEASSIPITDQTSPAFQKIQQALNAYNKPLGETLIPTGWEIYPALLAYGYSENQAIQILAQTARDSILANPQAAFTLYRIKLKNALTPPQSALMEVTFTPMYQGARIVGAEPYPGSQFFSDEQSLFPYFIPLQQRINEHLPFFYAAFYRPLVLASLVIAFFALYQKQWFRWMPLTFIAISRMFVPVTIGIAHWHYMLAGMAVLLTFLFLPIQTLNKFIEAAKNPPID